MAAGEGFKTFSTGDILTAADVNGYLMQGVWVFDDAADRTAQVTSPAEGNFSYLRDTNKLYYYTGSAWAEADTSGILPSEFTAKGDLLAGTGSATFDNLAVGANGTVLTADSSTATGLKWSTPSGGKVVQVVTATATTDTTIATTTFTDTSLTATITPTSASNTVLIIFSQHADIFKNTGQYIASLRLMRGSTSVWELAADGLSMSATGSSAVQLIQPISVAYSDSPATTSATTYKVQGKVNDTNNSQRMLCNWGSNVSTITLIEVSA